MASPSNKGKNIAERSTSEQPQPQQPQPPPNSPALSRYESQKRRDWNTLERQRFMHMDRRNPMQSHDVEDGTTGTSSSNLPS
ncbi:BnaCnng59850D [Brassica napus]|uniref:BnaCnng59850D protein n=1 Tax=Brassica napus TaxID=3708 RepID=A0A078JSL0_BRANA|nr:BnaCnng59850D [Brassica napus]